MNKSKICIMTTVHQSLNGRIFHKQAKSLAGAGYDVVIIGPHHTNETINNIRIVALGETKNRIKRMLKLTFNELFLALKEKADVYHLHDPELLIVGILLKMLTGKKVIYDVHEDYAEAMLDKSWLPSLTRIPVSFGLNILEQLSARLFDQIIAATPVIAHKFPATKASVIRNFPLYDLISEAEPLKVKKERPVVIYAGGLSETRGIKEIIQAVGLLKGSVELWLLGPWERDDFKTECEMLHEWQFTKYLGHKTLSEVYAHMKAADVGLFCCRPLPRYLKSLPIKYFEYLACGVPVILSSSSYWENIFGDSALFASSPRSIADNIMKLIAERGLREYLVNNGMKHINNEYNWRIESGRFLDVYEKVLGEEVQVSGAGSQPTAHIEKFN